MDEIVDFAGRVARTIREHKGERWTSEQLSHFLADLDPNDHPLYADPTHDKHELEKWQELRADGANPAEPPASMIRRRLELCEKYAVLLALHAAYLPNDDSLVLWLNDEVCLEGDINDFALRVRWQLLVKRSKTTPATDLPQLEQYLNTVAADILNNGKKAVSGKGKKQHKWKECRDWMLQELKAGRLAKSMQKVASDRNNKFDYNMVYKATHESPTLRKHFPGIKDGESGRTDEIGQVDTSDAIYADLLGQCDPKTKRYVENQLSDDERNTLKAELAAMPPEDRREAVEALASNPNAGRTGDVEGGDWLPEDGEEGVKAPSEYRG